MNLRKLGHSKKIPVMLEFAGEYPAGLLKAKFCRFSAKNVKKAVKHSIKKPNLLKGCVHYIFANLFFMSKREHFRNKEECFSFHFESSFLS